MTEQELMHFGIIGQKKGVRRWQNPDGTFNEAGKKRYFGVGRSLAIRAKDHQIKKKRKAALEKARQVKADKKKAAEEEAKKNPLAKYSTKELNDMTDRLRAEINYKTTYAQLHPEKKSLGKQFLDSTLQKLAKDTLPDLINTTLKTEGIKYVNKLLSKETAKQLSDSEKYNTLVKELIKGKNDFANTLSNKEIEGMMERQKNLNKLAGKNTDDDKKNK